MSFVYPRSEVSTEKGIWSRAGGVGVNIQTLQTDSNLNSIWLNNHALRRVEVGPMWDYVACGLIRIDFETKPLDVKSRALTIRPSCLLVVAPWLCFIYQHVTGSLMNYHHIPEQGLNFSFHVTLAPCHVFQYVMLPLTGCILKVIKQNVVSGMAMIWEKLSNVIYANLCDPSQILHTIWFSLLSPLKTGCLRQVNLLLNFQPQLCN